MDITILKQAGINTDSAIQRFMNNESVYAKILSKFLSDETYKKLVKAVSENNGKEALEASHTLKGISGNLSMDTLFNLCSEQVTLMREDKWDEAYAMMPEITENYEKVIQMINLWLENQA